MKKLITGSPIVTQKRYSSSTCVPRFDASNILGRNHQRIGESSNSSDDDITIVPIVMRKNRTNEGEIDRRCISPSSLSVVESNQHHELTAAMTIQYHNSIRRTYTNSNDEYETTIVKTQISVIASVHIYISPWNSDALLPCNSSENQVHQFVCSTIESEEEINGSPEEVQSSSCEMKCPEYFHGHVRPQLCFSSSGKYLSCVIPRPLLYVPKSSSEADESTLSLVTIFSLSSPKIDDNFEFEESIDLPQPQYLRNRKNASSKFEATVLAPIASNPHTLCVNSDPRIDDLDVSVMKLLAQIVSIADISFTGVELILAGCEDGSLLLLSYRNAMLLGLLYRPSKPCSICDLQCITYHDHARIAVVSDDGCVEFYQCSLHWSLNTPDDEISSGSYYDFIYKSKHRPFRIRTMLLNKDITPVSSSRLIFNKIIFIDTNTIAVLVKPSCSHDDCGAKIAGDNILAQVWLFDSTTDTTTVLSSLNQSSPSSSFGEFSENSIDNRMNERDAACFSGFIKLDSRSLCILVGYTVPYDRALGMYVNSKAFVTLWNWRNLSIGLTLPCPVDKNQVSSEQQLQLHWECEKISLLHEYVYFGQFKKDVYDVSILSPSTPLKLGIPNPMLLGHNHVAYPYVCECATLKGVEVQWKTSSIPLVYLENNGPIHTALIGGKYGKSLVLAGSTGICLLHLNQSNKQSIAKIKRIEEVKSSTDFYTNNKHGFFCGIDKFHWNINHGKWRMFRRHEEENLEVLSLVLWENYIETGDDLVIALVKYRSNDFNDRGGSEIFLSAWSSRCLEMSKQLLIESLELNPKITNRGVKIDYLTDPNLSILPAHKIEGAQFGASVLVTHQSDESLLYQVFDLNASSNSSTSNYIKCRPVLKGTFDINSLGMTSLFLAACWSKNIESCNNYTATIGVLLEYGKSLWAFSVDENGLRYKLLIFSSLSFNESPQRIVRFWEDDHFALSEKQKTWTLALTDGSLVSWNIGSSSIEKSFHFNWFYRTVKCEGAKDVGESCIDSDSFGIVTTMDARLSNVNVECNTYLLGPLPNYVIRPLLYVSQNSPLWCNDDQNSSWYDIFNFDLGIPSYTSTILLCLSKITEYEINEIYSDADALRFQLIHDLKRVHLLGNSLSSLRVISFFLTEFASKLNQKSEEANQKICFVELLQSQLVRVTMSSLNKIQFVSLFVSIGRQLELQQLPHLLPLRTNDSRSITTSDLFDISAQEGSLSISAAALPLFSDPDCVHNLCIELMHSVLCEIISFNYSNSKIACTREEFLCLRHLFQYCLKIEDAHICRRKSNGGSDFLVRKDYADQVTSSTVSEKIQLQRKNSLWSLLNPFVLSRRFLKNNENRISEAACSFVLSGYGEYVIYTDSDSTSGRVEKSFMRDTVAMKDERESSNYNFTGCILLMMSIISIVFLNDEESVHRFHIVPNICRLLYDKVEGKSYERINRWLCDIEHDDIARFVVLSKRFRYLHQTSEDFLTNLIADCKRVWSTNDAYCVTCGLLAILSRSETLPAVDMFSTGLVILFIPALHMSDPENVLASDSFKNCYLGNIYHNYL